MFILRSALLVLKYLTSEFIYLVTANTTKGAILESPALKKVGQFLFEENINGAEAFYELKMKFECKMSHFEVKIVNHASREMLGRINILDDAKFPSQLLASVISVNLQSNFFIEKTFVSTRIDFVLAFGYFIGDTYCKISVVHEYRADTFFRTSRKWRQGS